VRDLLAEPHGVNIPTDFTKWDCVPALALIDGKKIITTSARSIKAEFGIDHKQIAEAMLPEEIPDDVKTLLQQLMDLCKL
jgi:hypothetical protein